MSIGLIAFMGLMYLAIAANFLIQGNVPLAVSYFGGVIGNIGAYMMVVK